MHLVCECLIDVFMFPLSHPSFDLHLPCCSTSILLLPITALHSTSTARTFYPTLTLPTFTLMGCDNTNWMCHWALPSRHSHPSTPIQTLNTSGLHSPAPTIPSCSYHTHSLCYALYLLYFWCSHLSSPSPSLHLTPTSFLSSAAFLPSPSSLHPLPFSTSLACHPL